MSTTQKRSEQILENLAQDVQKARQARQRAKRLSGLFDTLESHFEGRSGRSLYIGYAGEWANLHVNNAPGFTSESNPQLLEDLEWLEDQGLAFTECKDYPDTGYRSYTFTGPEDFHLDVNVWPADSSACQRQITGYQEVVERKEVEVVVARPIYEFKC